MVNPSDHPLYQRVSHWINLINFLVLGITGWFIHSPYPGMPMNLVRNLHFFFMYFLVINGVIRFYYSFFGKHKDYKDIILNTQDLKNFWPQTKYYLFMGKDPETGKYNPLQKIAYISFPIMAMVQIITGAILYWPEKLAGYAWYFGGLAAVRGFHYLFMWLFIALVGVHLYLVFTEAYEQFLFMFFGKIKNQKGL
ncbi:Ni/Fe-hydrogenase, b-type cytochrome subunit [Desulfosporosinus fructosivorans]|uniref:Ni/Fe-hydrogenase, b-type cytochrome subunit n=1 Tax=Desulfosporosinus fructosivorans TaxID=2018669 RepID=A0A4Z0R8E3_9FIRM|nr:Ni/Fe-hydrogenase, b-type cytochrome subunit [Desulfosporosinus fructosivorans]TGE37896.1 Ni/Fe-hydrogenase, b-type cytochrome subunit [Desulfosporosinus fructosivorans]